jgi:nucleoside phosphorylase
MASEATKLSRSIELLKSFLKYYRDDYYETYIEVRPGKGWSFGKHSKEIYTLISNLYGNLYDDIAPLLITENTATDKQILDKLNTFKKFLEKEMQWFKKIYFINEDFFGNPIVGDIYSLVENAFYKLEEVLEVANQDITNVATNFDISQNDKLSKKKKKHIIGVITTTDKEFQALKLLLQNVVAKENHDFDCNIYYHGIYENENNQKVEIIFTKSQFQGISFATSTTTKLIYKYKPKYVAMLGYAAGNYNMMSSISIGDIMICLTAVDYNQNEIRQKKQSTQPNTASHDKTNLTSISINNEGPANIEIIDRKIPYHSNGYLFNQMNEFSYEIAILNKIKEAFKNHKYFKLPLKAHVGKFITGSALVRSKEEIDKLLKQNSGTIALDMETYGFYVACENSFSENKPMCIAIKSVSDFATHDDKYLKSDDKYSNEVVDAKIRQEYAAHTSAMFFLEFALKYLSPQ